MKKMLSILLSSLLLVACGGEEVKGTPAAGTDLTVPEFTWKIRTQEQLDFVYKSNGVLIADGERLMGFVGKDQNGQYVVYTTPPKKVDDQVTCTLGHEVMHIALGNYHKNPGD